MVFPDEGKGAAQALVGVGRRAEFGCIGQAGEAHGAADCGVWVSDRQLGGQGPVGNMIKAADQFEAPEDGPTFENLRIVEAKLFGEVFRGQVEVGFSKNRIKTGLLGIVEQESAVHPAIDSLLVFDPALHSLNKVEKVQQDGACLSDKQCGFCGHDGGRHSINVRVPQRRESAVLENGPVPGRR